MSNVNQSNGREITEILQSIERLLLLHTKQVLSIREAALLLGVSEDRMRHLNSAHEIPYYKQGGRVFYKKTELEDAMLGRRYPSNEEYAEDPVKYTRQLMGMQ